ncbi:MAG: hypothetical protein FJY67_03805 [Calditrichaeota bacterium]|nr:hypothetical protein [Calditrichota bacterium]
MLKPVLLGSFTLPLIAGCLNPFAPVEGDVGTSTWSDQRSVGGLLQNFSLAYDYRDSLRYADCLDEAFTFDFYDIDNSRFDRWPRQTDLKTTGGLFRRFNRIDLEWNFIPEEVAGFDRVDTTLQFIVRFNLTLENEPPLMGYARFAVKAGLDGRFRVVNWRDDF